VEGLYGILAMIENLRSKRSLPISTTGPRLNSDKSMLEEPGMEAEVSKFMKMEDGSRRATQLNQPSPICLTCRNILVRINGFEAPVMKSFTVAVSSLTKFADNNGLNESVRPNFLDWQKFREILYDADERFNIENDDWYDDKWICI